MSFFIRGGKPYWWHLWKIYDKDDNDKNLSAKVNQKDNNDYNRLGLYWDKRIIIVK